MSSNSNEESVYNMIHRLQSIINAMVYENAFLFKASGEVGKSNDYSLNYYIKLLELIGSSSKK